MHLLYICEFWRTKKQLTYASFFCFIKITPWSLMSFRLSKLSIISNASRTVMSYVSKCLAVQSPQGLFASTLSYKQAYLVYDRLEHPWRTCLDYIMRQIATIHSDVIQNLTTQYRSTIKSQCLHLKQNFSKTFYSLFSFNRNVQTCVMCF